MARRPKSTAAQAGTAQEMERLLGHRFKRPELLTLALTHRSFVYDAENSGGIPGANLADPSLDNEQLEFMGDAALGLLTAEALCKRFPGSREGELTRLRASVVSRKHLGEVGAQLDLGRWLRLGKTAEQNAGRSNSALFANAVEALIAALYLDGGLAAARRFVEEKVLAGALPEMERSLATGVHFNGAVGDFKSALQEMLQAEGAGRPQYRLVAESGPDHARVFRVEVRLDGPEGSALAEAEGSTKKQAQQEAARIAVGVLMERGEAAREVCMAEPMIPGGLLEDGAVVETSVTEVVETELVESGDLLVTTERVVVVERVTAMQVHHPVGALPALQSLVFVLVVSLFLMTFTVQPIRIPSASMEPTLLVGDFLLMDKQSVASRDGWLMPPAAIGRGDVVVFHDPVEDPSVHLVKRVVGLPGERIHLRDGVVYVNDTALREPYAVHRRAPADAFRDDFPNLNRMEPGVNPNWWIRLRGLVHEGDITVPAGNYFVMGDNRNDSEDSRYWGFVPRDAIVGKPAVIYFSWRQLDGDDDNDAAPGLPDGDKGRGWWDFARWGRTFTVVR